MVYGLDYGYFNFCKPYHSRSICDGYFNHYKFYIEPRVSFQASAGFAGSRRTTTTSTAL